jgi:endo-1,4-beta-D-glucanase Y
MTTGGGSGGSGMIVMRDPSNYPQNAASGGMFPYPQGHAFAHCTLPVYDTDKVATAYTAWKAKFFVSNRVVRPENNNDTASEGIAYGMLIGVYMNDKAMFDALWNYARGKLDGNGLMTWHYDANGGIIDQGGATDADQDMAWALLMADKQWPAGGYLSAATTLIGNIFAHEVDQGNGYVLKPGDNFGGANQTNPSYFAPSYYRVFARVTGNMGWMNVLSTAYSILNKAAGTYGLVPNWVNSSGAGVNGPGNDGNGVYFGYDACRTPWRIALDWCENGEQQAQTYLEKVVGFYAMKSAAGGLGVIRDGYTGVGAMPPANPSNLGVYVAGMAFIGPGGVAAMDGNHNDFASQAYATLIYDTNTSIINANGVFTYFNGSWGMLSLLTMSGNFWDMTR